MFYFSQFTTGRFRSRSQYCPCQCWLIVCCCNRDDDNESVAVWCDQSAASDGPNAPDDDHCSRAGWEADDDMELTRPQDHDQPQERPATRPPKCMLHFSLTCVIGACLSVVFVYLSSLSLSFILCVYLYFFIWKYIDVFCVSYPTLFS